MTPAATPRHPGASSPPEMAPDQPILPDFRSRSGAVQVLTIFVTASQIVLYHLDGVEHGLADLPPGWPALGPSPDDGPANPHARNAARFLARVPRNWAPQLVKDIDQIGGDILDAAFFPFGIGAEPVRDDADIAPDLSEMRRGTRQILAMMCPPRRWADAHTALHQRHQDTRHQDTGQTRGRIDTVAMQYPVAAIHIAAAQVAWLSLQPKLVPDWTARRTTIAATMMTLTSQITAHQTRS